MRIEGAVLVPVAVAFAVGGVAVGGDAKADLKKFQGTWAVEKSLADGKPMPEEEMKKTRVIVSGERFTFLHENDKSPEGTFKIDPGKEPKQIDVMAPFLGGHVAVKGIYKFEGGKLTICVASRQGAERPTRFESPEQSFTILVVLQREKQKKESGVDLR